MWQEGGGFKGYAGQRFQYGSGLGSFGRTLFRWARPLLKYLGKEGLEAGVKVGQDVLEGAPIKEALKKRARESGSKIATDTVETVKKKLKGEGMARRRRRRTTKSVKKPVIRRRKTVRRKRSRKRVKKTLKDIFT